MRATVPIRTARQPTNTRRAAGNRRSFVPTLRSRKNSSATTTLAAISPHPARIDGLTVLRGVAIGLVVLRHAAPDVFGGAGIVGVTIFFALSGWLISGILLGEVERTGRVDLRRFYLNRVFRLYPALIAFVVVALPSAAVIAASS